MEVHEAKPNVLSSGTTGHKMVKGITNEQFVDINEFPLKEQSKSWAAFGNELMIESRYLESTSLRGVK